MLSYLEVFSSGVVWFCYDEIDHEVPINLQELSLDPVGQSRISPLGEISQEL